MEMPYEGNDKACNCTKVNWGNVMAGAAVVTGVVLLASTINWTAPETGSFTLPEGIKELFSKGVETLGKVLEGAQDKTVAGALLVGGGLGFALLRDNKCEMAEAYVNAAMSGHSGREMARNDMRAMQTLMQARAQKFQQLGIPVAPSAGQSVGG